MDGESQQWKLVQVTATYKKIVHPMSGKVLDIVDMSDEDGAPAQIWEDVNGQGQQWKFVTNVPKASTKTVRKTASKKTAAQTEEKASAAEKAAPKGRTRKPAAKKTAAETALKEEPAKSLRKQEESPKTLTKTEPAPKAIRKTKETK